MPIHDFRCAAGHTHDELVKVSEIDDPQACPECGEPATRIFLTPPKLDWAGMAQGENAGPEFVDRFEKNHKKQLEKELKHEKEHGLPSISNEEIASAQKSEATAKMPAPKFDRK